MKISVIGGGHGCHAAAADLAEQGHRISLWRRDGQALAAIKAAGGSKCLTAYIRNLRVPLYQRANRIVQTASATEQGGTE